MEDELQGEEDVVLLARGNAGDRGPQTGRHGLWSALPSR